MPIKELSSWVRRKSCSRGFNIVKLYIKRDCDRIKYKKLVGLEGDKMEEKLRNCYYCKQILAHIAILKNEYEKPEAGSDNRRVTLLELQCYYWLMKVYYDKILCECECEIKYIFGNTLTNKLDLLQINEIELNTNKMRCDICRILPHEFFSLLDRACKLSNPQELESMFMELQYHVFLSLIYDELVGRCTDCDACVEYIACLENTCKYLYSKDQHQLQEFVYFWKKARNTDEIWSCADALRMNEQIESSDVNIDGHITVYLDFNVYGRYEKEPKIKEFLNRLSQQKEIDLIYSGAHLEEVLRMNNEECELKRIQSIQSLTHGRIAVLDESKKIVICIEDMDARLRQTKRYQKMNQFAEERECIVAEAREHLSLHIHDEQRDKAIGASSIQEIIENVKDDTGKKLNPNLPDEDDLNMILMYVGIEKQSIKEYKNMFKDDDKNFNRLRAAIVSMAELLNVLGLHGDKITNKNNSDAVYPIYDKKSFRTIRSGYYDNDHLSFASKCTYFVTTDTTLCEKAKEIYEFLGISTTPILLDEFMNIPEMV